MILDMSNASIKSQSLTKKKKRKRKKIYLGDTSRHKQHTGRNHSNINNKE